LKVFCFFFSKKKRFPLICLDYSGVGGGGALCLVKRAAFDHVRSLDSGLRRWKHGVSVNWGCFDMDMVVGLKVLVVEDDPDVGRLLSGALAEAGYEVEWAASGRAGMAAAVGGEFGLMILDRQLGDEIDGTDILKAVRERGQEVPALFLSGLGEVSDWAKGLEAGADDYLVKPFRIDELFARIKALKAHTTEAAT
jgi:CheY-like chemotaxis protein